MNVVRDEIIEVGRAADGRDTSSNISSSVALAPVVPLRHDKIKKLSWEDNPSVQALLDVVASIIAEEYIRIAKQNKGVFEEVEHESSDIR